MRAFASQRKQVVNIIGSTFDLNPSVNIVIGEYVNRRRNISRLASNAFVQTKREQISRRL